MRNVSNKSSRENRNTHFMFSEFFFSSQNRTVYETMSKNLMEPERTQAIWRLRVAYWVSKPTRTQAHARACLLTHIHTHTDARTHRRLHPRAHARTSPPPTHTHREICAYPQQQWLQERVSMLRYTYIDCLVRFTFCQHLNLHRIQKRHYKGS